MKTIILFFILIAGLGVQLSAQTEAVRVERLAGLGRVWGTVKYFHPYLAYRDIDWDKALVETIPKVNAAKTPQEYEAAIGSMLAALGDKNTVARLATSAKTASSPSTGVASADPVSLSGGILRIDAVAVAQAVAADNNRERELYDKTTLAIP